MASRAPPSSFDTSLGLIAAHFGAAAIRDGVAALRCVDAEVAALRDRRAALLADGCRIDEAVAGVGAKLPAVEARMRRLAVESRHFETLAAAEVAADGHGCAKRRVPRLERGACCADGAGLARRSGTLLQRNQTGFFVPCSRVTPGSRQARLPTGGLPRPAAASRAPRLPVNDCRSRRSAARLSRGGTRPCRGGSH